MPRKKEKEDIEEGQRYVNRRQMRKLCGYNGEPLSHNTLASDIKRGNVVEQEDRSIDMENSINAEYIDKKQNFELHKSLNTSTEQEKKKVELLKAKRDLEMKDFTLAKMRGEYIPKDMVHATFKAHFKEVYQQFFFASQQTLTDYVRQFGGTKEDIAKLKGNLSETINQVIKKARESSAHKIKEIEQEYAAANVK